MNSSMMWSAEARAASDGSETAVLQSELGMDMRLDTLREVTLALLREVESLRVSPPANIKRSGRLRDDVQRFEIDLIRSALDRTDGSQTRAAKLLGVKTTTLNSKIKRYKIVRAGYETRDDDVQEQERAA
jgi:transcriptional regulator with PAS, ATPase and Fis domain